MPQPLELERQQRVESILQNLKGAEPLKRLFWSELNYDRVNQPLSRRGWGDTAARVLADDPLLLASAARGDFQVIYSRLNSPKLRLTDQRSVVSRLLQDHPYAVFVFSNSSGDRWHFLNVKYDEDATKRRLFRRITVGPEGRLRTASERLAMLDLASIGPDPLAFSPLDVQTHHDEAFDVEKVTKDFYREIANWYFWALKHVEFPKDAPKEADGHDHISVIRLITRLIFCWFIREKKLIPDVLFDERRLADTLVEFGPDKPRNKESVFYRAILQNLFFATLNTEMDERGWRREDQNFMAHSLYRHKEYFRDPKVALEWFKNIPFLNGGLFECLDKDLGEGAKPRYVRIDGFSDRPDSQPTVPDFLFFGPEQEVDLSGDYGDKKFKSVGVRGLIDTLNRYKFTIEENTPFDQEVALDPELCGKVFENLLAAYNPETGTTARKATGSFYTPREIVDYMVDESLVAFLRERLSEGADQSEGRLRALLSYDDTPHGFSETETEKLIEAIDGLKALDPAVGSGAFPMGILHKLVQVLRKLDPANERWKAKQIAKLDDPVMREDAERVFRENYDDYGRKLYLIENCIYGVDIQPIAVQIAKMRFFISLIVDQKVNPDAPNLGVRALPNLETKFVAGNTLIGIQRSAQMMLRNPAIDAKEAELRRVRDKHFTAKTPTAKAKCREQDKKLRAEIAEMLKSDGWDNATAKQLATWDPYDQNASAGFFDSEWMFGITRGFDVVLGNPPYVDSELMKKDCPEFRDFLRGRLETTRGNWDLYIAFTELAYKLLAAHGCLSFITPNKWLSAPYGKALRTFLRCHLATIADCSGVDVFEAGNTPVVAVIWRDAAKRTFVDRFAQNYDLEHSTSVDPTTLSDDNWGHLLSHDIALIDKIGGLPATVGDSFMVENPFTTAEAYDLREMLAEYRAAQARQTFRFVNTGTIAKFRPLWGVRQTTYLKSHYDKPVVLKDALAKAMPRRAKQTARPKMIIKGIRYFDSFVDIDGSYVAGKSTIIVFDPSDDVGNLQWLSAILNSTLIMFLLRSAFSSLGIDGGINFSKDMVAGIRMPPLQTAAKRELRILAIKAAETDPTEDTAVFEREIDERVYKLYGLTPDEINIVEGGA